jgi:hypothetical protein
MILSHSFELKRSWPFYNSRANLLFFNGNFTFIIKD